MNKLSQKLKIDMALVPGTINAAGNSTGDYFAMAGFARALFVVEVGAMAVTATSVAKLVQATAAAGTGSKDVASHTATITANTKVKEATVVVNVPDNGDAVVINSLTFTKAAATAAASREFADADGLVTCINHGTYGCEGLLASNNAGTVTIKACPRGDAYITLTTNDAVKLAVATTKALCYIDLDASKLDAANGFTFVAINVASTVSNIPSAAALLRGDARFSPAQKVAASY